MKQMEEDLIRDMIESIDLIEIYSKKMTRVKLLRDQEKQDSIARRPAIIGEIAARLPKSSTNEMNDISWSVCYGKQLRQT
ncbi:MAG: hypothetical protein A3C15_02695 [Candidatus Magasanikbacteria bacterium RIFCSPHIGHO2_02_FULL_50_9b]|uniref:Uncharacterized protein n=1 Tax=Candidatus Magasanikbacteria bacterium RIFCSPHIGHO2_02_FULL_50_9b TaxID=1798682 RepID=A0A1F6M7Z1_9BACT|nr:MAG: hypothetical protein A3C15_02695 [Candidatus Magasanikbacteria bacterium RIFCSPHIGHO2_02_FULL_50_9b]